MLQFSKLLRVYLIKTTLKLYLSDWKNWKLNFTLLQSVPYRYPVYFNVGGRVCNGVGVCGIRRWRLPFASKTFRDESKLMQLREPNPLIPFNKPITNDFPCKLSIYLKLTQKNLILKNSAFTYCRQEDFFLQLK